MRKGVKIMNKKRLKQALCAAAAISILLTGCSGTKTNSAKEEKNTAETVLTWYIPISKQNDMDAVMEKVNEKLKEKIGATLNLVTIDTSAYDEKMNMKKAGGEAIDLCFTSTWTNKFINSAISGAYIPLDDYYKDSVLKDAIPQFVWDDTIINGKMYAVPNYQIEYIQACVLTPKRLADKYSLDPESIKVKADLEPYLTQIRDNEPDFFPYNPVDAGNSVIASSKGYGSISGLPYYSVDGNGKLVGLYDSDVQIQHYEKMRDWFKKGLIRKDVVSAAMTASQDCNALKYAAWVGQMKPGSAAERAKSFGEEILEIPIGTPKVNMYAAQAAMTAISINSENPDKAWELLEVVNTDKELFNLLCFGIEGRNYEKIGENMVAPSSEKKYKIAGWILGNQFNAYLIEGQDEDTWEVTEKNNLEAERSVFRGMNFDFNSIKTEITNMSAIISEYKWLDYGIMDYAEPMAEAKQKLMNAGAEKVKEEAQKQVDEFLASKK